MDEFLGKGTVVGGSLEGYDKVRETNAGMILNLYLTIYKMKY